MNMPEALMSQAVAFNTLPSFIELQRAVTMCGFHGGSSRGPYSTRFGYALPCREAIAAITALNPFLEVGAGNGFWSYWLKSFGCDAVASDPMTYHPYTSNFWITDLVKTDGVTALRMFPKRTVLMVWPRFDDSWSAELVEHLSVGQFLIYVGEGFGGCCAPPSFFLELVRTNCELVHIQRNPSWIGTEDYLSIYRKRARMSRDTKSTP